MKKWAFIAAGLSLALAACTSEKQTSTDTKEPDTGSAVSVYTTIYPLQYFAERIGGDTVNVTSIMPAGADEHTYEPTSKTMLAIAEADLFLYNGLNLEPFADKAKETLSGEEVSIVNVGDQINLETNHSNEETGHEHLEEEGHGHAEEEEHGHAEKEESGDGHEHGGVDPHIWLDPVLAQQVAKVVKNELVTLNPDSENVYEENYNALIADLKQLDEKFHSVVETAEKKEILVSHAAYGYWEKAYGIEQISISGLSPTDEPSQKQLKEIADTAKEHNIQYVIFEQNVTTKVSEVIRKELGAGSLRLHNLGTLTEEDVENNENYFSIMEQNIDVLKKAMN